MTEAGGGKVMFQRSILSDDVYEHLRSRIMLSEVEPGQSLPIEVLARELGVSPTPVREALLRLEAESLVAKRGPKGYFANPLITREEFEDLWDFRELLEPWACARAAERVTPDGVAALQQEINNPAGSDTGMDFSTYRQMQGHDQRFHGLLLRLGGNREALEAFQRTHVHVRTFRIHSAPQLGPPALEEHARIAETVMAGDAAGASAAMRSHLERSRERLRPHLS